MQLEGKHWLILGGALSIAIAILHIVIIFAGAPAYRYFGAGEEMAQMASSGSVLPTLATFFLAVIFAIWGLYAFSGAGLVRPLPLLQLGLVAIAGIYTLRGLGVIPQILWMFNPSKSVAPQDVIFSVASLLTGLVHFAGTVPLWKNSTVKPLQIKIAGHVRKSSEEICAEIVDTERWSEFEGYSILPGIEHAHFELKTPQWVGSRIRVQNKDGSSHVEEIIEWDATHRVALKFQEFTPPLQRVTTHFIETWEFQASADGTHVTRSMTLHPKGIVGWLMLAPISRLMKKAFEKNLLQVTKDQRQIESASG